jgi:hypothetical protein
MKDELADECHYSREASFLERYRRPDCLGADARFILLSSELSEFLTPFCACDTVFGSSCLKEA